MPEHFTFKEVIDRLHGRDVLRRPPARPFNSLGLPASANRLDRVLFELSAAPRSLLQGHGIERRAPLRIWAFLNSAKALAMIRGDSVSVVVAFFAGLFVQYLPTSVIFSFNYKRSLAASIYSSCYGRLLLPRDQGHPGRVLHPSRVVPGSTPTQPNFLSAAFAVLTCSSRRSWSAVRINIFPIIILAGTFSLAFVAGNDLVNFIGPCRSPRLLL